MEVQNFVFNTPKTCFNALTGQKIADDVIELFLFRNQWVYTLSVNDGAVLWDEKKHKIVESNHVIMAFSRFYLLENDDNTQSLYDASGKVLFDKVQEVLLFPCGWFVVCQNGEKALYRDDASFVLKGFLQVTLTQTGVFVLAEYEPDDWTVYRRDGSMVAEHVKDFQFLSETFYSLTFEDKIVIYDDKAQTQIISPGEFPRLLFGNRFVAVVDGWVTLFRANGKKMTACHKDYFSFDNGLFLVKRNDDTVELCNAKCRVLHKFVHAVGSAGYQNFLIVTAEGRDYLYDNKGKLIYQADNLEVCGGGFFLEKKKNQKSGTLLKYDLSVVAEDVLEAEVFHNGWMMLERAEMETENFVFELCHSDARRVAVSGFAFEYDEKFKVWVRQNKKGKFSLWHEVHGCVVRDADRIILTDALALSRRGNICSIYSLTKINVIDSDEKKVNLDFMLPIWSGSGRDLLKTVALCGGDCLGNEEDFFALLSRPDSLDPCFDVIRKLLNDDVDDK